MFSDTFQMVAFSELSPEMQHQAVTLIVDSFYQHRADIPQEHALTKISNALQAVKEIAFCVTYGNIVVGISTYSLYDYCQLKDQMYLETDYQGDHLSAMRLMSFHDLLEKKQIYQGEVPKAAGFGYSFVLPAFRNKGLAKRLFQRRLEDILSHQEVGVIFAIIRGPYAQQNVSPCVLSSLLEAEERANGREGIQRIKVTGVWVGSDQFEQELQLPVHSLNDYSGAPAMTKLIADGGFVPIGFFRSLSPVWVTTRTALQHQGS